MESLNLSGLFNTSSAVINYGIMLLIIGGVVYFIWYLFSFRHILIIKEKFGRPFQHEPEKETEDTGLPVPKKDAKPQAANLVIQPFIGGVYRAKVITKKNVNYLSLMFKKGRIKIPDQAFQNVTKKGKKFIELVKLNEHAYAPCYLADADTGTHEYLFDEGWFDWLVSDIERDQVKYFHQTWWERYGNFFLTAGLLIIMLIMIIATLKHSQEIVNAAKPLAQALADAAEKFTQVLETQNI